MKYILKFDKLSEFNDEQPENIPLIDETPEKWKLNKLISVIFEHPLNI